MNIFDILVSDIVHSKERKRFEQLCLELILQPYLDSVPEHYCTKLSIRWCPDYSYKYNTEDMLKRLEKQQGDMVFWDQSIPVELMERSIGLIKRAIEREWPLDFLD